MILPPMAAWRAILNIWGGMISESLLQSSRPRASALFRWMMLANASTDRKTVGRGVTGVQTCALPICLEGYLEHLGRDDLREPLAELAAAGLRLVPVDDAGERVHRFSVDQDLHLDEVRHKVVP